MKIEVAQTAGFCFGVRRAVDIAFEQVALGRRVCTLGPIIHNPYIVGQLEERGVTVINTPEENTDGRLLIVRSHGVGREVYHKMKGMVIVDATCPFVQKIHRIVENVTSPQTTEILIAGDPAHPEVQGIVGHCAAAYFVFSTPEELEDYLRSPRHCDENTVILVAQTTFNENVWKKSVIFAKKVCTKLFVFDTICSATIKRQEEAAELAKRADLMVVIGGKHSSNTTKLRDICAELCPTVLVEDASGLAGMRLAQYAFIGVTAGASTPACIIKEVQETMSNLDNIQNEMSFEEMLEQSFKSTYNGEKVTAVVTGIAPNEISVDIGTKHAGYVPLHELTDDPNAKTEDLVKKGDELELMVIRVNDVEGTVMLSKKRLDAVAGFEKVMNAAETNEILEGVVVEVVRGGVLAATNGVRVFIPASQSGIPRDGDLNDLLRKNVRFRILETNRQRRRAVGSISALAREERAALAEKFWSEVEVGKQYTGNVKSITNFGVFVGLGGVDGRIGMSDLCWHRVKHPSEVVSIGDTITVSIKDIDLENKKVSLIYKKAEDNPWEIIREQYTVGMNVPVKIMSITGFGAFAQIIPGIDGLIHISQVDRERIEKVADKLTVGDEVTAKITELDLEKKRVSLSIRAVLEEQAPAEESTEASTEE